MSIPTNMVDAAAQIKDGTLGPIEVVKIGDLIISALQGLQAPKRKAVTKRRVQAGYNVTQAAIIEPQELIMNIVLANPDLSIEAGVTAALTGGVSSFLDTWREKKAELEEIFASNSIVTVSTHEGVYPNMMIEMIDPWFDVDENWDCFIAQVTMTEVDPRQSGTADGLAGAITSGLQSVGGM